MKRPERSPPTVEIFAARRGAHAVQGPVTFFVGTLLTVLVCSCGSSGSPMQADNSGDGPTTTGGGMEDRGGPVKSDPSFADDIYPIFESGGCNSVGCHGSGEGGLYTRTVQEAYTNLVNVTSPNSGEVLVIPGDDNASYLVKKLENRQSVGLLMPFGGPPLPVNDIQNVRNWIKRGAKNN